jgi:bacterioferritin
MGTDKRIEDWLRSASADPAGSVASVLTTGEDDDTFSKEILMKGNEKILAALNMLLADELTAINQYMVHSEMCANWGYEELHDAVEKRAMTEMKHAEMHIGRIIFLEGRPVVSQLNPLHIGATVLDQFNDDLGAEQGAVKSYNEAVKLAVEVGDNGTRAMLESILKDEEEHLDWLETQLDQIEQIGIQNYLAQQVG